MDILTCNIDKCRIPLNEVAWVTRCMHVFCPGHGQAYFSTSSHQINCPICHEINLKEVDILQGETNPSDMVLAGIPPLKAISLASKSLKLWFLQIEEERKLLQTKINTLEKKNAENKHRFSQTVNYLKKKCLAEVKNLRAHCSSEMKKVEMLTKELQSTRDQLRKYKLALASRGGETHGAAGYRSTSSQWYSSELFCPSPTYESKGRCNWKTQLERYS